MSLEALDQYIIKNGHLPGVPTNKEAKANGVDLGKLGTVLLEKLEEVSLYLIQLKKENRELKKQMLALNKSK